MDDNSCISNVVENVPVDEPQNCSDVKLSPFHIKVCTMLFFTLLWMVVKLINCECLQVRSCKLLITGRQKVSVADLDI